MEPIILMNSKWGNDIFTPMYLFFGGLTGGLFIVAVVADLVGIKYKSFEKTMLVISLILGLGTLVTIFFSAPSPAEIFAWGIPTTTAAVLVFLSLLGWGAGSGPDLMIPYSWWVAEKGYQNLKLQSGGSQTSLMDNRDESSVKQIKEWLNIAKWDTIAGYIMAGIVATVFMIAGAVILQPRGIAVEGLDVLRNILIAKKRNKFRVKM